MTASTANAGTDLSPPRTVICADALEWLRAGQDLSGCAIITSLPDVSELSLPLADWKRWFVDAAALVMEKCPPDSAAIFFQTDIKPEGVWLDKGWLCHQAAERTGMTLLWHKIACRKTPGTITFGRPAYSHLLCYSKDLHADLGRSTADVLPDMGPTVWTRGMGIEACRVACRFVREQTRCRTVVDPFCGRGTVLAVANEMGLGALGVELCRKRSRQAKALTVQEIIEGKPGDTEKGRK
ncbi:MAG: SAM-dependent methyltransferase [Deltaproteobacteria bacterium]|nr:SAM-dependent methyltransferase [Deltaproteobacteria bacterium]